MLFRANKKLAAKLICIPALAFITGWACIGMATSSRSGEDFAAWIFVHEWLERGETLYINIWDHKDFGFFLFNFPFFEIGGTIGLLFGGLFSTALFGGGIFIGMTRYLRVVSAIVVSLISTILYVLSPTFLATYTENQAIALAVLAIALLGKAPVLAGVILAASTSVKVAGFGIAFFVIVLMLVTDRFDDEVGTRTSQVSRRFGISYLMGIVGIGVVSAILGVFRGWMEIITYNIEYSAERRSIRPSILEPLELLRFLIGDGETRIFLVLLLFGTLTLFAVASRTKLQSLNELPRSTSHTYSETRAWLAAFGLALGTFLGVLTQLPARPHHLGYLVGSTIYIASMATARILQAWKSFVLSRKITFCVIVTFIFVSTAAFSVREDGITWPIRNPSKWGDLDRGKLRLEAGEHSKSAQSLAFVNFWGLGLDFDSLPSTWTLNCRFFYHLPHLVRRFEVEMLNCLRSDTDIVVLGTRNTMDSAFKSEIRQLLETRYVQCENSLVVAEIWSLTLATCPRVSNTT